MAVCPHALPPCCPGLRKPACPCAPRTCSANTAAYLPLSPAHEPPDRHNRCPPRHTHVLYLPCRAAVVRALLRFSPPQATASMSRLAGPLLPLLRGAVALAEDSGLRRSMTGRMGPGDVGGPAAAGGLQQQEQGDGWLLGIAGLVGLGGLTGSRAGAGGAGPGAVSLGWLSGVGRQELSWLYFALWRALDAALDRGEAEGGREGGGGGDAEREAGPTGGPAEAWAVLEKVRVVGPRWGLKGRRHVRMRCP